MYSSLARSCYRHPWRVLAAWAMALAAVVTASVTAGASFGGAPSAADSDSGLGRAILAEHFDSGGNDISGTIVFLAEDGVADNKVRSALTGLFDEVDAIAEVTVTSPYEPGGNRLIASQGPLAARIAYAEVDIAEGTNANAAAEIGAKIDRLVESQGLRSMDGVQVEIGGAWLAGGEPPESEAVGLAFAVFVLIAALGSVVAMGVTVATALVGVGFGVAAIALLSNIATVPEFAPTLGVMIGLGVGIDYALFIITRHREFSGQGLDAQDAVAAALDSSGRSVIFAGLTVVVSLLGLLLMGLPFVAGLGLSAAVTVALVMVASVTVLPAVIGLIGDRLTATRLRGMVAAGLVAAALFGLGIGLRPLILGIPMALFVVGASAYGGDRNPLRRVLRQRVEKPLRETRWYRLSRVVQARPWLFAVGGTVVLLALAAPVLGLRLGFSDEGNYPQHSTTRKAYDLLAEGFGPGANGPLLVVAELSDAQQFAAFSGLSQRLRDTDGVAFASQALPSPSGAAALIRIQPTTGPQDAATESLVRRMRGDVIPDALDGAGVDAFVSGQVAFGIDFTDYLSRRIPVFFAAVLGASFLLLMAVFRSLVVPLKAVIMNMLSIGAAYGVSVAVFQWGWFGDALGIEPAPIEPFIPMMLFAILFGLSMDYEVFLLSRMKEEFERSADPVNSVADGLAATARVITAAAAIMAVVFGSFVFEESRVVRLFGLGLATAVAIDATLVRMLIVPSTMELLGARNWWLPKWLDRIIPNLRIEGAAAHRQPEPNTESALQQP